MRPGSRTFKFERLYMYKKLHFKVFLESCAKYCDSRCYQFFSAILKIAIIRTQVFPFFHIVITTHFSFQPSLTFYYCSIQRHTSSQATPIRILMSTPICFVFVSFFLRYLRKFKLFKLSQCLFLFQFRVYSYESSQCMILLQ